MKATSRTEKRLHRHRRVRKKVQGSAARPRLNIFRSSKHIYAQIVDDVKGHTLAAASSLSKELEQLKTGADKEAARAVGKLIAQDPGLRLGAVAGAAAGTRPDAARTRPGAVHGRALRQGQG